MPVGIVGFILAWRLVPDLETHSHKFDIPGVVLWAVGMFCLVFGIQEGETFNWGQIWGPISVWGLIVTGIVVLGVFVWWQRQGRGEPLLPLHLFADRNFSLANGAIAMVGVAVTANALPLVFYYQLVLGFSPTRAALQLVPMALFSGGAGAGGRTPGRPGQRPLPRHRRPAGHGRRPCSGTRCGSCRTRACGGACCSRAP